jgi:phage shock protein PspC (stress-responsive transcriptional regulator)
MGTQLKWTRASDGAIFGVCKGVARALDVSVGGLRLAWILSTLFLGVGLGFYIILAIALPRADKGVQALDPRLLGVCSKISLRTDLEVGIVRFLAICLGLMSGGTAIIGYIILYFVLDSSPKTSTTTVNSSNV